MTAPRSRKDSQAATRLRLLEVAAEVLGTHGYRAASLDRIAEAAGYSKGAVYSNFSGKEELTLEVLDRQFANRLVDLADRLTDADPTPDARVGAFLDWWRDLLDIEGWGRVIVEFASATRDNPEVQDALAARQRMIIDYSAELFAGEAERFGLDLPLAPKDASAALVALSQGLTFARMLAPDLSPDLVGDVARILFLGGDPTS
jgi:AcrR family transcriptional regulator